MSKIRIARLEFNLMDDVFFNRVAAVLYAAGCKWKCAGCHSKALWNAKGKEYSSEMFIKKLLREFKYPEKDLTVVGQGGDFWFQLENWIGFCKDIKKHLPNIKIAWQTGASKEDIKSYFKDSIYPFDVIACERPFAVKEEGENRKYLIWSDGHEEWKVLGR